MLQEVLSLGDKIDIMRVDQRNEPVHHGRAYVSQLIDFADLDVIHIATPIVYGRVTILEVGENYKLCFYTAKGLYQCIGNVLNNYRDNKTVVTVVRITTDLVRLQRREYYRMECLQDITYHVITEEEGIIRNKIKDNDFINEEERIEYLNRLEQLSQDLIPGSVTDISGGGIRFNSGVQHKNNDKIRLNLSFINDINRKSLEITANIVMSNRIENRIGQYEHRVKYIDITPKERECIIKYIFEQERIRRRYETRS